MQVHFSMAYMKEKQKVFLSRYFCFSFYSLSVVLIIGFCLTSTRTGKPVLLQDFRYVFLHHQTV